MISCTSKEENLMDPQNVYRDFEGNPYMPHSFSDVVLQYQKADKSER